MKAAQSIDSKVLNRIYGWGRGKVFTPSRFLELGSRDAVDKALSRLAKKGTIRRLAVGVYDYPQSHPQLGLLLPSTDDIATALAKSSEIQLQPSGAYAANLLGLSEQVPMKVVYLTTGTPRRIQIGKREITLKRTTPRQMMTAGRISGLVIQAFRHLGKTHVNSELLQKLRARLSDDEKQQLLSDLPHAPSWMAPHLRELSQS